MTYAIIETGGKQLRVEAGRFYDVERLHAEPNTQLTLDKVLLVEHEGNISVGQPFVAGATVDATVLQNHRGRKIIVYKMQPKKKTRKKRGHRQELTRLMIDAIALNGSVLAVEDDAAIASESSPDGETAAVENAEDMPTAAATEAEETTPEVEAEPEAASADES